MPSPFPGMDPYLEDPVGWPTVHHRLITYLADTLSVLLPRGYVANIGERVYVEEAGSDRYPDVGVVKRRRRSPMSGKSQVSTAVAERDQPWIIQEIDNDPMRESYVEILHAGDEQKVITVVEICSPTNKAGGTKGRRKYLAKQRLVLASSTNLVEIDLLRDGQHTVAARQSHVASRGPYHYLVNLSRAQQRDLREVWGITLRQRLPRISVPLEGDLPDVVIDLQELFTHCYDVGRYDERIDYRREPAIALPPDLIEWAHALLRKKGLRK